MNIFEKCKSMVKENKVNLIHLSSEDELIVSQEIMDYLNNRFPNRRFFLNYKSTNQIKFFNVSEKVDFMSHDLLPLEIGNTLLNIHMHTVFEIISSDLKQKLLNKYQDQLQDKRQELLDYLDSFKIQLNLLGITDCVFELKEKGNFVIYTESKTIMLGGLKDFKSYDLKYDIVTHFDLDQIKDMTNKYIKMRRNRK